MQSHLFSCSNRIDKVWNPSQSDFTQSYPAHIESKIFSVDKRKHAAFLQGSEATDLMVSRNHQNQTQDHLLLLNFPHSSLVFTTQPSNPVMVFF